jgi:hypothetical protein
METSRKNNIIIGAVVSLIVITVVVVIFLLQNKSTHMIPSFSISEVPDTSRDECDSFGTLLSQNLQFFQYASDSTGTSIITNYQLTSSQYQDGSHQTECTQVHRRQGPAQAAYIRGSSQGSHPAIALLHFGLILNIINPLLLSMLVENCQQTIVSFIWLNPIY